MNLHKIKTKKLTLVLVSVLESVDAAAVWAQGPKYPPLGERAMAPEAEVSLARSAAPDKVSGATVKILTASGYEVAVQGDNGFICIVVRSWAAATFTPGRVRDFVYDSKLRAPICFGLVATRTVLPLQELRAELGVQGKDPDAIAREVATAYAVGKLPKLEGVAFAYMWSANQDLGPGVGAFHRHMMVFAPYYENSMLGSNELEGSLPFVLEDAGTPFAMVVIPVHGNAAVARRQQRNRNTNPKAENMKEITVWSSVLRDSSSPSARCLWPWVGLCMPRPSSGPCWPSLPLN